MQQRQPFRLMSLKRAAGYEEGKEKKKRRDEKVVKVGPYIVVPD